MLLTDEQLENIADDIFKFSSVSDYKKQKMYTKKDIWNGIKFNRVGDKQTLKKIYNQKIDLLTSEPREIKYKKPKYLIRETEVVRLNNILNHLRFLNE